jgi:hypothetical protein
MSDRMKLTLASLTIMMLPYQISFPLTILIVTAILSTAIAVVRELWARHSSPVGFIAASFLYHTLKSRPLLNFQPATEVIPGVD